MKLFLLVFIIILISYYNIYWYVDKSKLNYDIYEIFDSEYSNEHSNMLRLINTKIPFFSKTNSLFEFKWNDKILEKVHHDLKLPYNNGVSCFNQNNYYSLNESIYKFYQLPNIIPFNTNLTNDIILFDENNCITPIVQTLNYVTFFFIPQGTGKLRIFKQSFNNNCITKKGKTPIKYINSYFNIVDTDDDISHSMQTCNTNELDVSENMLVYLPYNSYYCFENKDDLVIQCFYHTSLMNHIVNKIPISWGQ